MRETEERLVAFCLLLKNPNSNATISADHTGDRSGPDIIFDIYTF